MKYFIIALAIVAAVILQDFALAHYCKTQGIRFLLTGDIISCSLVEVIENDG